MRNKKIFLIFVVVALFFSCKGSDGEAYLKYSWVGLPTYFYDSNPSTPQTVTNGVYFHTNPGSYYMEYKAFDNSRWYMNYQITINEIEIPNEDSGISILQARDKTGLERGPIIGREERNIGAGVIKIEYGRLIE